MANEKAALVEMYNGSPGHYGFPPTDGQVQSSFGEEPSTSHTSATNMLEDVEPPSYQETAFETISNRPTSPPPRPPPPRLNRQTPLPMVVSNPPADMSNFNHVHSATVILNAPVTSQPAIVTVNGIPPVAVTQQPSVGLPLTIPPNQDITRYITYGPRPFSSGICNCCMDCHTCCCGTFCTCCYLGAIGSKLDESCMTGICCMAGLIPLRTKFRIQHNITGSICDDICLSTFCSCCVVCQMGREMEALHYKKKCCCC
ncbi:uncharacterized protein LOC120344223 [Styela clava]